MRFALLSLRNTILKVLVA